MKNLSILTLIIIGLILALYVGGLLVGVAMVFFKMIIGIFGLGVFMGVFMGGLLVGRWSKKKHKKNGEKNKEIIYNAMQTPDGTVIESKNRHDYVSHMDKNGETYMVDGGKDYLKRSVNEIPAKELTMYLEPWTLGFHEKAREVVKRGGRGINGDQPLTWVPICKMNDGWVKATIDYNANLGLEDNWFTTLLVKEVEYRKKNTISIE